MRPYHRHLAFLGVLLFILALAVSPALAATTVDVQAENTIVYPDENVDITATVTVDNTSVSDPQVQWSLGNGDPSLGTLDAVYGEAVYTPKLPETVKAWDSVTTVVYAVYGKTTGELPLTIYPAAAQNDALARAKAYLRAQQAEDGSLTDDWAAIALATAGENMADDCWLKNDKGHLDTIATAVSNWDVGSTSTTTIARTLLAVASAKEPDAIVDPQNCGGKDLIALLQGRQDAETGHFGLASEANLVNTHIWSILALNAARADIPYPNLARDWIIHAQNTDGGWGWSNDPNGYSDSNDTATAIRALVVLSITDKNADQPLGKALSFLKTTQADDGGFFCGEWDLSSDSNSDAEVIQALVAAEENPQADSWSKTEGLNAVSHLLSLQMPDGSFQWQAGINGYSPGHDTAMAVLALACLDGADLPEVPSVPPGKDGNTHNPDTITVTAEVRGLDGATMYPSQTVTLESSEQTPLGALEALGADVETGFGGGYVVGIDGLGERQHGATSGWTYLVNGSSPSMAANDYDLHNEDDVLWRYVRSLSETGNSPSDAPFIAPSLTPTLEGGVNGVDGALTDTTAETRLVTFVLNTTPLNAAAADELARALNANRVALEQEVNPENQTLVGDELLEAALRIPAGALDRSVTITLQEQGTSEGNSPAPLGQCLASGIYEYGPDGQSFNQAVTVYIRCLPEKDRSAGDLVLAWFDPAAGTWHSLPAVYDPATGLLAARVTHFTRFAALSPSGPRPAFTDLNNGDETLWFAEALDQLAARGVIGADEGPAFCGEAPVTRAAFTGWLARGLGLLPGAQPTFTDLASGQTYQDEIGAAAAADLVRGLPGNIFAPDKTLTRQELAAILVRAACHKGSAADLTTDRAAELLAAYSDGDTVADWARIAVAAAVNEGLMVGVPGERLDPCGTVTRAEAAAFVQRLLN